MYYIELALYNSTDTTQTRNQVGSYFNVRHIVVLGKANGKKGRTGRYREQSPYRERLNRLVCNLLGK